MESLLVLALAPSDDILLFGKSFSHKCSLFACPLETMDQSVVCFTLPHK